MTDVLSKNKTSTSMTISLSADLHVENTYSMLLRRTNGASQRLELDIILAITIFDDHDLESSSMKSSSPNPRTRTPYI